MLCSPLFNFHTEPAAGSFALPSAHRAKINAPIIRATCAFDAKIYKNVDNIFTVSPFVGLSKKFFKFSDFSF